MMRISRLAAPLCSCGGGAVGAVAFPLLQQRRLARYANMGETLKPGPGDGAGQMSILNEICCNPDAEEERRKPTFRHDVAPATVPSNSPSYIRNMYLWGYHSLSLFKKTNEDPGPWWNANSSTLVSNWSQVGDYANAGMWSGVWRYTYGVGEYNLRPFESRGRAWGRRDKSSGALSIRYGPQPYPLQRYCFPHTKEHDMHRRVKNPVNKGFAEITALHGKRVLREVQHHLGNGLRFYLVDGVFGSHPSTATAYRVITDNPTHAYFLSLAAIRKFNYVAQQEMVLVKRVKQSPIDEWGWRRPGVLVYHAPGYDFEMPRIVEEFGGPRPRDMGLSHNRFIALEPYSIPMKAVVAGEPSCDVLLDTTAGLCARWGFYADDKGLLTVPGDSVMAHDGSSLTLVISAKDDDVDALRASPWLYGSRHHRIADGVVSRVWDVVSVPKAAAQVQPTDLIEEDLGRVQHSLPLRMGMPQSVSHRQFGRRHVSEFGFKLPHNYTEDAASKAYAGGHLFSQPKKNQLEGHQARPTHFGLGSVDVVIIGEGSDAAAAVMNALRERGMLYAEEAVLQKALASTLQKARSVKVVAPAEAAPLVARLAKSGK